MSGGCIHQARKCPVCERDAEIARLTAALERAEKERNEATRRDHEREVADAIAHLTAPEPTGEEPK